MAEPVPAPLRRFTAEIAENGSLSGAVDLGGYTLVGIQFPADWTSADASFQAAAPNDTEATYANIYDVNDDERVVEAAASRYVPLDFNDWIGVQLLKVRSGTSGSPVNQTGGDKTVELIARPI